MTQHKVAQKSLDDLNNKSSEIDVYKQFKSIKENGTPTLAKEYLDKVVSVRGQAYLRTIATDHGISTAKNPGKKGTDLATPLVLRDRIIAKVFPTTANVGWMDWVANALGIKSIATGRFKPTGSGTGKGEIHEAAQAGALTFTDADRELGATVRNDLSVIADEATWQRAKDAAGKSYGEDDDAHWSAAAAIYQRMGGVVRNIEQVNNQEDTMNRDQAINHLTTNCDCWKGKKDLLANKTHFTDDDITKLMTNFQAGQLAVNSLKEIGQAVGAPATLTINAMPAFVKEKVAAAPAAAKCPECGAAMADGKCPDCGYGAAAEPEAAPVGNKKRTTEQWIADAPPEAREMLNGLINNERTVKTSLITKIVANAKAGTKERLQKTLATKSVSELRDLVSLLPTNNQQTNDDPLTNYFGAGGGSNDIIVDNATSQADGVDYDGPWPGVVRMHAKTA